LSTSGGESKGFSHIFEELCSEKMGNPYCSCRERLPVGTPEVEMVDHIEISFRPEPGSTFFAYVNIGSFQFMENRVMFGRISVPELDRRINGTKVTKP